MAGVAAILAVAWVTLLLVGQPVAAFLGRDRLEEAAVPRRRRYRSSAIGIGAIGIVSLALDVSTRGDTLRAVVHVPLPGGVVLWCIGTVAVSGIYWVVSQLVRKIRGIPPHPGIVHLLPRTPGETRAFLALAVLAGVCEEFAIRGFCLFEVAHLTESWGAAAVLTTLGFGLGHAYQGLSGVLRTTLVGTILVVPVLGSGSLLPSMAGHAVIDAMTGLWTLTLLRRWGLASPEPAG